MVVTVRLFAGAQAALACNQVTIMLPVGGTVGELLQRLRQEFPALASWPGCRIAVNQRFAHDAMLLDGSEEVAFIPPVSGG